MANPNSIFTFISNDADLIAHFLCNPERGSRRARKLAREINTLGSNWVDDSATFSTNENQSPVRRSSRLRNQELQGPTIDPEKQDKQLKESLQVQTDRGSRMNMVIDLTDDASGNDDERDDKQRKPMSYVKRENSRVLWSDLASQSSIDLTMQGLGGQKGTQETQVRDNIRYNGGSDIGKEESERVDLDMSSAIGQLGIGTNLGESVSTPSLISVVRTYVDSLSFSSSDLLAQLKTTFVHSQLLLSPHRASDQLQFQEDLCNLIETLEGQPDMSLTTFIDLITHRTYAPRRDADSNGVESVAPVQNSKIGQRPVPSKRTKAKKLRKRFNTAENSASSPSKKSGKKMKMKEQVTAARAAKRAAKRAKSAATVGATPQTAWEKGAERDQYTLEMHKKQLEGMSMANSGLASQLPLPSADHPMSHLIPSHARG